MTSWETTWEETAKRLPMGHTEYTYCTCGKGRKRSITNLPDVYITSCFRCHETRVKQKTSLSRLFGSVGWSKKDKRLAIKNPKFSRELTNPALAWLGLSSITPDMARAYRICMETTSGRCVIPIPPYFKGNGFIARALDGQQPKYISQTDAEYAHIEGARALVLVEDMLSAIRIREASGLSTMCVLGTGASPGAREFVVSQDLPCVLWFDGDEAGEHATKLWSEFLSAMLVPFRVVRTPRDPKTYTSKQIRGELNGL